MTLRKLLLNAAQQNIRSAARLGHWLDSSQRWRFRVTHRNPVINCGKQYLKSLIPLRPINCTNNVNYRTKYRGIEVFPFSSLLAQKKDGYSLRIQQTVRRKFIKYFASLKHIKLNFKFSTKILLLWDHNSWFRK